MKVCVETPKWIWAYTEQDVLIYELSRMIREAISLSTERPRTSYERLLKRVIAKLLIAKVTIEVLASIRKDVKREMVEEIVNELDRAVNAIAEKVKEL